MTSPGSPFLPAPLAISYLSHFCFPAFVTKTTLCLVYDILRVDYWQYYRHYDTIGTTANQGVLAMPQKEKLQSTIPAPVITGRQEVEQASEESEDWFRLMVETSLDYIFQTDGQGRTMYCSPSIEHVLGYHPEEREGTHFSSILVPSELSKAQALFERVMKGQVVQNLEIEVFHKNGRTVPVEVSVTPLVENKKVTGMFGIVRDITERKQTEEALRQAKEKYRTILEEMEDSYFEVDLEGNYTFINDQHSRALGYSREETVGLNSRVVTYEEDYRYMLDAFNQAYQTGKPIRNLSYRVVGKDGEIGWTEVSAVPMRNQQGEIIGFRGIGHDITERRRIEREREIYLTGIENAYEGIVFTKMNGDILYFNKSACQIFGYTPAEMKEMNISRFSAIPADGEKLEESVREEGRFYGEIVGVRKSGETFPAMLSVSIVKDDQGEPVGRMGVFTDIAERKQAEHDLKQRIKELQCLYAIASTTENPKITLDELYQEVVRLLPTGWQYPDITCARIIIDDNKFETWNYTETEWNQSSDIKVHGGKVGTVEVNYLVERPEVDEGPFTNEERSLIDAVALQLGKVTERKRMRQDLIEKTRQLEAASQAKSEFLASMSHELRTPLNAVIGFSELMLDGIPGEINNEQKQCLSDILNSGQHLLNLINDVLDIARVEAGKVDLRLENLNLSDVINDVLQTVRPMLDANKHRIKVSIENGLPQVRADEHRLRQILLNLLSNAIKFTPPGGELRVEVSKVDGWCQTSVVDNGIGIKKEDQERIFESFTQVDALSGNERTGTGLGLALARELVEMCGGKIWVESEYEKGSRFTFTLPLS